MLIAFEGSRAEEGFFFFQAEDGIRDLTVTGVQTCALPISRKAQEERERQERAEAEERERQERAEAEARARQRAEQEAREAAERECRRLAQERLDGRALLVNFVDNYGKVEGNKGIAGQITAFLNKARKVKPCPPALRPHGPRYQGVTE